MPQLLDSRAPQWEPAIHSKRHVHCHHAIMLWRQFSVGAIPGRLPTGHEGVCLRACAGRFRFQQSRHRPHAACRIPPSEQAFLRRSVESRSGPSGDDGTEVCCANGWSPILACLCLLHVPCPILLPTCGRTAERTRHLRPALFVTNPCAKK